MSQWWPQVSWLNFSNLSWMIIVILIIPFLILGFRRTIRRLKLAQASVSPTMGGWTVKRGIAVTKGLIFCLALLLLIISSAGPRWGWTWVESKQSGIDMVVAVDVSRSMMARDLDPTRLERARRMIIDLLDVADGDRMGLVVFAGAAFVQCPLTVDHGAMRSFVDGLNTDMIPVGGTDLAGALHESLRALDAGGEQQGLGKLIILLTDGEDHKGGLDEAIAEVLKSKVKVVTVGLASAAGSPVVDDKGGFIKDQAGDVVVSRLMEGPLRKIAEETGGAYMKGASNSESIADFYQNVIRAKGTVKETQAKKERVWFERFQWTASMGLLLLILEGLLVDVQLASKVSVIIGAVLLASAGRPVHAATSVSETYNAAVQSFESGDVEAAKKIFEELAQSANGEEQRRSLYNLGNILAAAGKYDEAAGFYEKALALDYQDQQVRDNLAWVKKRSSSEQQKNEQNKENNNKQDQKDDQKGKQENSDGAKDQKQSSENDKQQKDQGSDGKNETSKQNSEDKQSDAKQDPADEKKSTKGEQDLANDKSEQPGKKSREMTQPKDQMTPEQAEKLLRAAPDDRKSFVPIFRGQKAPEVSDGKDW